MLPAHGEVRSHPERNTPASGAPLVLCNSPPGASQRPSPDSAQPPAPPQSSYFVPCLRKEAPVADARLLTRAPARSPVHLLLWAPVGRFWPPAGGEEKAGAPTWGRSAAEQSGVGRSLWGAGRVLILLCLGGWGASPCTCLWVMLGGAACSTFSSSESPSPPSCVRGVWTDGLAVSTTPTAQCGRPACWSHFRLCRSK